MKLKNKKGQALVEFVIILPIILMILFIIIDFSHVYYERNHLEGTLNDIVYLVKENKHDNEIKKIIDNSINYKIHYEGEYAHISMTKEVMLVTPFSNLFL